MAQPAPDPISTVPRGLFTATLFVLLSGSAVFFAGSVAAPALARQWDLSDAQAAWLTSAVQLGFVAGTLLTVAFDLPDRFRPRRLLAAFLVTAAVANVALVAASGFVSGLALRFLIGALSGPVYPIGMRLLATWYPRLGLRLGVLLGAYTFGVGATAVFKAVRLPWQQAVIGSSVLALVGAVVALMVLTTGPLLPTRQSLDVKAAARSYRAPGYRNSSLAYFGHMWELFALWALAPFWLASAGWSGFALDALVAGMFVAGGVGCILGGLWSHRVGEARVARLALTTSGVLCLLSPWLFDAPSWLVVAGILVWGAAAVADSPMFSALSAVAAPRAHVGAALTVQNGIGFAVPVGSLALVPWVADVTGTWRYAFVALALGPMFGLPLVWRLVRMQDAERLDPDALPGGVADQTES